MAASAVYSSKLGIIDAPELLLVCQAGTNTFWGWKMTGPVEAELAEGASPEKCYSCCRLHSKLCKDRQWA